MSSKQNLKSNSWAIKVPFILLVIGFFSIPFSPTLNSLILISGIWCIIYKPLRSQLKFLIHTPAFWLGLIFIIWIFIRCFHDNQLITSHSKWHYFFHYLNLWLTIFLLPPLHKQKT